MSTQNIIRTNEAALRRGWARAQGIRDGGNWSLVLDMPLDIMNEFLLSVDHVYDLLSLARSCRAFKELLSSQRALLSIWKPAMERSIDLPPPLPGRSNIPQWVSMLHDNVCQAPKCNLEVRRSETDFWMQRRYCFMCPDNTLIDKSKLRRLQWASAHGKLVPELTWSYIQYSGALWHRDDLQETDSRLAEIGDDSGKFKQFCEDRRQILAEARKVLKTLPPAYTIWLHKTRVKNDWEASLQRPTEIRARLKELGYGEEEDVQALSHFDELKPSSTPFNSRSWGHVKKKLIAAVIEAREVRACHQWPILCARRRSAVDEIYKRFQSRFTPYKIATGFFPSTYELCLSPALKARIEAPIEETLTPETFADLESTFPQLLASEEDRLKAMITIAARPRELEGQRTTTGNRSVPSQGSMSGDVSAIFLATTAFECPYGNSSSCESLLFGWEDVYKHRCVPRSTGLATGIPQVDSVFPPDLQRVEEITLHLDAVEAVKSVIQKLGLDPTSVTTSELNMLNPIIACKSHPSDKRKHGRYRWRSFVRHVITNPCARHNPQVEAENSPLVPSYGNSPRRLQREDGLWHRG